MLAVQAWCAAIAREMASTAIHKLLAPAAKITLMMVNANSSIDSRRALTGAMPRPIRNDESMPPPTLPKSALR
ncbi:hypothetical protein D3C79_863310 [compost metagenome]